MIAKTNQRSTESEIFKESSKEEVEVTISCEEYENLNYKNQSYENIIKQIATLYSDPYESVDNVKEAISIILKKAVNEETIGKLGELIYNKHKIKLEATNFGNFVVIDTDKQ